MIEITDIINDNKGMLIVGRYKKGEESE